MSARPRHRRPAGSGRHLRRFHRGHAARSALRDAAGRRLLGERRRAGRLRRRRRSRHRGARLLRGLQRECRGSSGAAAQRRAAHRDGMGFLLRRAAARYADSRAPRTSPGGTWMAMAIRISRSAATARRSSTATMPARSCRATPCCRATGKTTIRPTSICARSPGRTTTTTATSTSCCRRSGTPSPSLRIPP